MKLRTLLLALLALPLVFTSCVVEEDGMGLNYDRNGNVIPSDAVLNGTGLPSLATLEKAVFSVDKEENEVPLGHVEMGFSNACTGSWCNAFVDDCGINSNINFSLQDGGEEDFDKISFRNVEASFVVDFWANEGEAFTVEREGAKLILRCDDCTGEMPGGDEYTGKYVELSVLR